MKSKPPISFYFDAASAPPMPTRVTEYFDWQREIARQGKLLGPACWTVQTYLHLQACGYECQLVTAVPDEGIVISHYDDIPKNFELTSSRYWVCLLADRPAPHPYVQYHVLQNPMQHLRLAQPHSYVPLWPQAGLIRRDSSRGYDINTVCFFGERVNLAPELASDDFARWCNEQGIDFRCVPRDHWHDYSDCDVVVAVRSFASPFWSPDKPATKLVNAWLAETPAILGRESAFRVEGHVGEDYLEAAGIDDVRRHLLALRSDNQRVRRIIMNGRQEAKRLDFPALAARWQALLERDILPRAAAWASGGRLRRRAFRAAGRIREGLAWRGILTTSSFKP